QRPWYCVSRHGRVGRRQTRTTQSHHSLITITATAPEPAPTGDQPARISRTTLARGGAAR
ncbi:hypothetical protein, partial [Acetobacter senegalensis]|uniref:hypothetical protein n=1 Tax=Acetobacter senegalensis TaxID=446692 RepID=UPI001EE01CEA